MKRWDIWIIIFCIGMAAIFFSVSKINKTSEYKQKYVEIFSNGKLFKKVSLQNPNASENVIVETDLGKNIIQIEKGKVRIIEADCPDRICIKNGWISEPGQMIVCLPHKLVIEIKGDKEIEVDDFSY